MTTGAEIKEEDIRTLVAGKKKGQALDEIRKIQGVKEVSVELSPFWVSKIPKNSKKVKVTLEQQDNGTKSIDANP